VRSLAIGAVVVAGVASYLLAYVFFQGSWWRFVPSTAFALSLGALVLGRDALRAFGIPRRPRELVGALTLLALALPFAYAAVGWAAADAQITIVRTLQLRSSTHQLFQVLNEEIVRAALLILALRLSPRPMLLIPVLALLFAIGHRLVYAADGFTINLGALLTLFSLGVVANTLFVRFRHIGFGFALHYAWNFWRFNTSYFLDGRYLSEADTFNYIEGNPWVVAGSGLAMAVVYGSYLTWEARSSHEPAA
jgi:hypothetical protein